MGWALIEFRGLKWLTLVAALTACTADVPESPRDSTVTDTSFATGSGGGAESTPVVSKSPEPPTDALPDAETLTADGWGPLRIGMSLVEITAAAGGDAAPGAVGGPNPARCDEFRPSNAPEGVLVMVERGVLTRISVSKDANIRTPEGLRIGDPEAKVLDEYGTRGRIDPHQYWESPAKYITVWREPLSAANRRGIRYEIDSNGNVAHLRAGGPSIEYVEGCS